MMNVPALSTNGIKMMHDAIAARLKEEDALPAGQAKAYGVRQHPDFKEMADEFEAELASRSEPHTKIVW